MKPSLLVALIISMCLILWSCSTSTAQIKDAAGNVAKNGIADLEEVTIGDIGIGGGAALKAIKGYRKKHGGLWVGGVVEITPEGVIFSANALNKILHTGPSGRHISIKDIKSVHREFGWVTGIVVIEHEHGEFRFRCFGANGVAKRLTSYLASL